MKSSILLRTGAALLAVQMATLAVGSPEERVPNQLRDRVVRELASGRLLVAARGLPDPNFAETIVLLTDFSPQGAVGLIVNRPTEVPLLELLPGLDGASAGRMPIFLGGPVPERGALALLRSGSSVADVRHIVDDVYLVNSREALDGMISRGLASDRLRVYVGYAGWGAGQLQRETALGSWHVVDGEGDVVFDPESTSVWRRQMRRIEARSARDDRGGAGAHGLHPDVPGVPGDCSSGGRHSGGSRRGWMPDGAPHEHQDSRAGGPSCGLKR